MKYLILLLTCFSFLSVKAQKDTGNYECRLPKTIDSMKITKELIGLANVDNAVTRTPIKYKKVWMPVVITTNPPQYDSILVEVVDTGEPAPTQKKKIKRSNKNKHYGKVSH